MTWRRTRDLLRTVRCGEVVLMVGFPAAAGLYGMTVLTSERWGILAWTVLGMLCFAISVYAINSLFGRSLDARNPKFASSPLLSGTVTSNQLLFVIVASLAGGVAGLALAARHSMAPVILMLMLWVGWAWYSHPKGLKSIPFAGSALHVVAGAIMFLVPYTLQRPLDLRGSVLAAVFSLAFASGHANHEIIDRAADAAGGVRTTAVVFGARWVHWYGTCLAMAAYTVAGVGSAIDALAWQESAPFVALGAGHVVVGLSVSRTALDTRSANTYRTIYRLMFAAATMLTVLVHLTILWRREALPW